MSPQTLPKFRRISQQSDFDHSKKKGKRKHDKDFFLVKSANQCDVSRLAIVASRKCGNAVARNYWKRQTREFFRKAELQVADYVLVLKPSIKNKEKQDVKVQIEQLFAPHILV